MMILINDNLIVNLNFVSHIERDKATNKTWIKITGEEASTFVDVNFDDFKKILSFHDDENSQEKSDSDSQLANKESAKYVP